MNDMTNINKTMEKFATKEGKEAMNEMSLRIFLEKLNSLEFTDPKPISSITNLPDYGGICECYNQHKNEYIYAYSNEICRRFEELRNEENTRHMTHFAYARVDNHDDRVSFRREFKTFNNIAPYLIEGKKIVFI